RALDLLQLASGNLAACECAACFEHRDDIAMLRSRADCAAVDEHRGTIETRERDQAAGHVLVAAADRDDAVESLRPADGLDRVRDDLARYERVAHARRAVRNAVRHGDRAEDRALAARAVDRLRRRFRELVDMHVARREITPRRGDADRGLLEIGIFVADRAQHRAAWGLLE